MAWTTPRTWVTGELVTASILNTHVRDDLSYLKNAPTFDGAVTVTGTLQWGGGAAISSSSNIALLSAVNAFTGFGTHSFSAGGVGGNIIALRNSTAGVGNYSAFQFGNDAAVSQGEVAMFSTTFTTSAFNIADSLRFYSGGAGGLSIVAGHASGVFRVYTGGTTKQLEVSTAGIVDFTTSSTNTAPSTDVHAGFVASGTYYGVVGGTTMGAPGRWLKITSNGGVTYKIPLYQD